MLSAQHPDRERGEVRNESARLTHAVGWSGGVEREQPRPSRVDEVDISEDASRQLWEEQQLWSSCAGMRIPTTSKVTHMLRFDSAEVTRPLWAPRPSTGRGGETSDSTKTHVPTRNAPPYPLPSRRSVRLFPSNV